MCLKNVGFLAYFLVMVAVVFAVVHDSLISPSHFFFPYMLGPVVYVPFLLMLNLAARGSPGKAMMFASSMSDSTQKWLPKIGGFFPTSILYVESLSITDMANPSPSNDRTFISDFAVSTLSAPIATLQ